MKEIWKDIPGYEGHYQASNLGHIKSLTRSVWNGSHLRTQRGRMMKFAETRDGYLRIEVVLNGRRSKLGVHRLVALTFLGPPPSEDSVVDHKDNNPKNNSPSNLQYCTVRENTQYGKLRSGVRQIGATKVDGKWVARVHHQGVRHYLGYFPTKKQACDAYVVALREIGEGTFTGNRTHYTRLKEDGVI